METLSVVRPSRELTDGVVTLAAIEQSDTNEIIGAADPQCFEPLMEPDMLQSPFDSSQRMLLGRPAGGPLGRDRTADHNARRVLRCPGSRRQTDYRRGGLQQAARCAVLESAERLLLDGPRGTGSPYRRTRCTYRGLRLFG